MFLFDTNYPCALSKVAFASMIEDLNSDLQPGMQFDERYVAFVDGDTTDVHNTINQIYDLRNEIKIINVITLLSKNQACSAVVKHLSDFVVDKRIAFSDLQSLVKMIVTAEPKVLVDDIFGDILGKILKTSKKESWVLQLLLEGYSQSQIAKMLHLSIKTVSGYKVKAVKLHGTRNFNELYMRKFANSLSGLQ